MKVKVWILIFFSIGFTSCQNSDSAKSLKSSADLTRIVQEMEGELSLLNTEMTQMKNFHEALLTHRDSILASANSAPYNFLDGFSTNLAGGDSTLSSIVILEHGLDLKVALEEITLTNSLDSIFKRIKDQYSFVAQVYSNSSNQISRVFPAFDAKKLISREIDLTQYNFYYEANEVNNPSKGPVWIEDAYVDPAGRGWILSIIQPIYDQEKLFAVLGIDITVDQIISRYLNTEEGNLVIATKKGDIVAASVSTIEALSFPPLRNHIYKEIIQKDNFRISDYNLFNSKNKEVRKMADQMLLKNQSYFEFSEEYSPKSAQMVYFDLLDWVLIEIKLD